MIAPQRLLVASALVALVTLAAPLARAQGGASPAEPAPDAPADKAAPAKGQAPKAGEPAPTAAPAEPTPPPTSEGEPPAPTDAHDPEPPAEPAAEPPHQAEPPVAAPTPLPPPDANEGASDAALADAPEPMSEGRAIVVAWNTGFQWGIAPGVIFQPGRTSFALGVRLGYGFDTGSVILVPGARLAGYFTDPSVYVGMPVMKLVLPIDRFAPFVEGGAGIGHVTADQSIPSKSGAALFGGGGFMVHFTPSVGLGVEANYQVITGTGFKGFGVGPILALAF